MPSGVPITGTLRTYPNGQYPTNDPATEIDGWRSVADHPTRNAIPDWLRRQGMAVFTQSDSILWVLNAAPWAGTDGDWTALATVGSVGTVTSVGLTMPSGFSVANSPVTGSGTLAVTTSLSGILQASSGAISAITVGSGLTFSGGTLSAIAGAGLTAKTSVIAASTANLNATYANGSSGVGATLTNAGTLAALTLDGISFSGGERVLIKDQSSQANNGIYTVTTVGSGAVAWVLTRATDDNQASNIAPGDYVVVAEGTANQGTLWVQVTLGPFTVGTTAIVWLELTVAPLTTTLAGDTTGSGSGTITTTTGKVHGVAYPAAPATNTVPVVTGSNTVTYEAVPNAALANSSVTITAGTGLSGGGSVSLGGSVSMSLTSPVPITLGGTDNTSFTAYAVVCGGTTATGALQSIAGLGTPGQVLTSNGAGALPSFQSISGVGTVTSISVGTGLLGSPNPITGSGTISVAPGTINTLAGYDASGIFSDVTIGAGLSLSGGVLSSTAGGGTVVSVAAGTGLTATPTNPITGSGTIAIATGGVNTTQLASGAVTYAKMQAETGATLLGNPSNLSQAPSEITLGSGLAFSGTTLVATGGAGTVTSVGLTMPSGFSVASSPVTGSGTIAVTTALSGILQASAGAFSAITVGSGLSFSGGTLSATGGTGTVTSITAGTGIACSPDPITGSGTVSLATIATARVMSNVSGSTAAPIPNTMTATLDACIGTMAGSILFRGSAAWGVLQPTDAQLILGTSASAGLVAVTMGGDATIDHSGNVTVSKIGGTSISLPLTVANGGSGTNTLTAHAVLLGEGTSAVAFATIGVAGRMLVDQGASADPVFASTGLKVDSHYGVITADVDGSTITFNLATSDWHTVTLGGNRTLALSNPTVGQQFTIILVQDAGAPRTVTWFSGIKWPGGTIPTLTATANAIDVFTFKCVSSGVYYGFTPGQNMS